MGIRVHKVIGYGVTDFKAPKQWHEILDKASDTLIENFLTYCSKNEETIKNLYLEMGLPNQAKGGVAFDDAFSRQMLKIGHLKASAIGCGGKSSKPTVDHLIHYQDEGELGLRKVVVFLPASGAYEWHRGDDPIDYVEETTRRPKTGFGPRVKELKMGLFPYMQGKPPPTLLGLLLWIGMTDLAPRLKELLYVYWS